MINASMSLLTLTSAVVLWQPASVCQQPQLAPRRPKGTLLLCFAPLCPLFQYQGAYVNKIKCK